MKNFPLLITLFALILTSCSKDDEVLEENTSSKNLGETTEVSELEVEEFIYAGMNEIYLYKADVPVLADNYFGTENEKLDYLAGSGSPESLFKSLKFTNDRFSFMTDDYKALEDRFNGVSSSTAGMHFGLGQISGTNNLFGFLQYIIPNTPAAEAGLTRGTVFTQINGQKMTSNNLETLLDSDSFTINIGKVEDGTLVLTDETVTLHQASYTANPIHMVKTLDVDGKKVGYLMYNSFIGNFDDELNLAFGELKNQGVEELILDLRYNGGGDVVSAVDLASMITGQFEGKVFMQEKWNDTYQAYFEEHKPERLLNLFDDEIRTGAKINSLGLLKVYVLATASTASASELIINGLDPYINVVHVGENTTGKFQASVTLYDSEDFSKDKEINKNHTYALQPLVLKSANANGISDYINGLDPDVELSENINNLGTLGDPNEPLLQAALNHIRGISQISAADAGQQKKAESNLKIIGDGEMFEPHYQRMYLDKVPDILRRN
ncbi:S41 family peptidase [Salinimicrobium terrae]|uniref:S41 family peptidase n=1 Tax=Salinimicrobium terrae TaxID=470866 RepID=UPI001FDFA716|nr:S41 family peptidase [Salinimicrobium terrae]